MRRSYRESFRVSHATFATTLIEYCSIGLLFGVRLATVFVWYGSFVRLWWICIVISTYLQEDMFRDSEWLQQYVGISTIGASDGTHTTITDLNRMFLTEKAIIQSCG